MHGRAGLLSAHPAASRSDGALGGEHWSQWDVPEASSPLTPPTPAVENSRTVVRREVARFAIPAAIGLVLLVVLSLAVAVAVAREQSQRDARLTAQFLARSVVEPRLNDRLVDGSPVAIAGMDDALAATIEGSDVLGLRLWDSNGVIVYADDPRVIGEQFDLGPGAAAFAPGAGLVAEPADVTRPENRYLDPTAQIVDVSLPVTAADGRTYLLQIHQLQDEITADARAVWLAFAPVLVGSLVLVALLLGMLAVRMARRISADLAVRQELLQRSIDAGDIERRRIAAQLHDGTVQDLAGLSYTLAGLSARAEGAGDAVQAEQLSAAADTSRDAVTGLRRLLVDIYPANLQRTGLAAALGDLGAALQPDIRVTMAVTDVAGLDAAVQAAVYRVAREALANVAKHAGARSVAVSFSQVGDGVELVVADDGCGFDPDHVPGDHLGLAISADLAQSVGGVLDVTAEPGAGTTVTLRVDGVIP